MEAASMAHATPILKIPITITSDGHILVWPFNSWRFIEYKTPPRANGMRMGVTARNNGNIHMSISPMTKQMVDTAL